MAMKAPARRQFYIGFAATILLGATVVIGLFLGTETRRQFRDISAGWSDYAGDAEKKGVWISSIRGYLGYGGIIHNFKNFVLRQDEIYLKRLQDQLAQFHDVILAYAQYAIEPQEKAALDSILKTIAAYEAKLPIAKQAAAEKWPVERTDQAVRVDDTKALAALQDLERIWSQKRNDSTERIIDAVGEGETLIGLGFISLFALVVVALSLGGLLFVLLRDMQRALERLSNELAERRRLEQSEKRLARAVEQSPATIVITDTDGRIQYVNRRFEELTGFKMEEIVGRTPRLLQSGDTPDADYNELRKTLERGEEWHGTFRNRKKSGDFYWADTAILPLKGEDGEVNNYIGIGEDITEKKKAREQVARAQKMEAVGLLAGGVAHDFNNILTTIIGAAHLAGLDAEEGSDIANEIAQIDIAAKRAQSLVQQLLTFARRQPAKPRPIDLCAIIGEIVRLIRVSVPPTIAIEFKPEDEVIGVLADPTHLHQVIMNLCRNAVEAIGGADGCISLGASRIVASPLEPGSDQYGDWIRLSIEDNGAGMSADIAKSVFDPFFTTKPMGKGTGLGLTVVATLVQDMRGQISLESEPGKGTRFSIMLPGADTVVESASQKLALIGGHERILIVDDEADIAATFRRFLIRLGYQVEAFSDPVIAIERYRADPDRFDLVVTDLVMPGMNGEALVEEIWRLNAKCPVIMCTAYRPKKISLGGAGMLEIMDKPIDPPTLAQKIRAMLPQKAAQR